VLHAVVRHGHWLDDDSRVRARGREDVVGSEAFVVLMLAAFRIARSVREGSMRLAVRALSHRSCLGYDAGDWR
jgi:hypothetical protein